MSRRSLFGFAAAACVACCAGPFLAAIGGIAALGAIGTSAFGVAAAAVAGLAIVVLVIVRSRRKVRAQPKSQPVELEVTRR